jgi:hypothetical protein
MNYDVNKKFSSTSHGNYLEYHINKEDLKNNKFRFILITQKKEHAPKIFWEALIKNLFPYSKNNTLDYHKKSSQEMFFHMKEEFYSWANNGKFLEEHADIIKNKINKLNIRPIEIEYEEIIKPSGSYYLQKKLNLNITEKDHKYWKEQLQKSHSPLEVECFGKIFRYEDLLC